MGRKQVFDNTELIVNTAFNLIKDEGFKSFSTRRLAIELGISKTTAYNYLKSKESIIEEVVAKAIKIYHSAILQLINKKKYQVTDIFELLLVRAEVIYDFVIEFRDIYKLTNRQISSVIYDKDLSLEQRFGHVGSLYTKVFPEYRDDMNKLFPSQDILDKHQLLTVLINNLAVIEMDRKNKIGKNKHMELVGKSWSLITETPLPWHYKP